ncbi:hypothetical protein AB0E81_11500 [Streptomyces sp. NPDC033538]|uniref:hypothetical protein n=1 Tax=Streptomyces sp. NPDC033538 TaxID=3155367 RepID=UPI0033C0ECCE
MADEPTRVLPISTPITGKPSHLNPSVGRVVRYVSYGTPGGEFASEERAAIITEVPYRGDGTDRHGNMVGLAVLNPTGFFFNRDVPYDEHGTPGTWHWPERG